MKMNHLSDATKILILVAAVIIVCIMCAVGFKMVNEGKSAVNASTNNLNSMTSQYQDVDIAIYDGADVQGSEVVNLIQKSVDQDKYLAIGVLTLRRKGVIVTPTDTDFTYYNYLYSNSTTALSNTTISDYATVEADPNPKKLTDYINPFAQFSGKVLKDQNGLVVCVQFIQLD